MRAIRYEPFTLHILSDQIFPSFQSSLFSRCLTRFNVLNIPIETFQLLSLFLSCPPLIRCLSFFLFYKKLLLFKKFQIHFQLYFNVNRNTIDKKKKTSLPFLAKQSLHQSNILNLDALKTFQHLNYFKTQREHCQLACIFSVDI